MTRTPLLAVALSVVCGVALSAAPAYAAPGTTPAPAHRHASGLLVAAPQTTPPKAAPDTVATALHDAWERAEQHPDLLGYPWADASGVVVDGVGAAGERFAQQFRSARGPAAALRTRTVKRSFAQLEALKHEIIGLTSADVPDGETIWETVPDGAGNRVIVTVERESDALLNALAKRYGTEAIVVRVDGNRPKTQPLADRNYDGSPFWGGAQNKAQYTCTSAFPWVSGSTPMMVTAGHCSPTGGTVLTPVHAMGLVTPNSRESWNNGTGTVYLTGQGTYRGDIALGIAAKGIFSGGGGGGSDAWGGATDPCFSVFTDIWDAFYAFPGTLKTV
ncbi:hypothetical protein [Dactylosporangium sp. NPDC000521]|uniref:hypothetical protein n=1 Tax=Dactylosporangium sp. NPDC000521 TaxID=3363975 RepID=UPI0036B58646